MHYIYIYIYVCKGLPEFPKPMNDRWHVHPVSGKVYWQNSSTVDDSPVQSEGHSGLTLSGFHRLGKPWFSRLLTSKTFFAI